MKVCVCLCYKMYLNMREVTITAPRSKRQTEKDPREPGHSQPRMSTEDRSPHISAISPSPSQQEKEGGPSWGAHGQRVGVPEDQWRRAADPIRGRTLILSQSSSKLQTRAQPHTLGILMAHRDTQRHMCTNPDSVPNPGIT